MTRPEEFRPPDGAEGPERPPWRDLTLLLLTFTAGVLVVGFLVILLVHL